MPSCPSCQARAPACPAYSRFPTGLSPQPKRPSCAPRESNGQLACPGGKIRLRGPSKGGEGKAQVPAGNTAPRAVGRRERSSGEMRLRDIIELCGCGLRNEGQAPGAAPCRVRPASIQERRLTCSCGLSDPPLSKKDDWLAAAGFRASDGPKGHACTDPEALI
jgi:hypothetical protein